MPPARNRRPRAEDARRPPTRAISAAVRSSLALELPKCAGCGNAITRDPADPDRNLIDGYYGWHRHCHAVFKGVPVMASTEFKLDLERDQLQAIERERRISADRLTAADERARDAEVRLRAATGQLATARAELATLRQANAALRARVVDAAAAPPSPPVATDGAPAALPTPDQDDASVRFSLLELDPPTTGNP